MDAPWLLLCIALFLLMVEFYLPGGVMAIISLGLYILAMARGYVLFNGFEAVLFFSAAVILPCVVVRYTIYRIKKSAHLNTFFLSQSQEGNQSSEFDAQLLGKTGVAVTDLGPSGFALIEGHRVQVVSQSGYIEKGVEIVVKSGKGGHLVVQTL